MTHIPASYLIDMAKLAEIFDHANDSPAVALIPTVLETPQGDGSYSDNKELK